MSSQVLVVEFSMYMNLLGTFLFTEKLRLIVAWLNHNMQVFRRITLLSEASASSSPSFLLLNIVSYWTGYTLKIIEQAFSALFNSVSVKKQNQPRIMKPDQGENIARCLGVYKVGEPFKCLQLQVWFSI